MGVNEMDNFPPDKMGALVDGWHKGRLGSLCERTETVDPRLSPANTFEYVDVSAIDNELFQIRSSCPYLGENAPSRARKKIKTGDVIFATVRPTLKRVAVVPESLDGEVVSTAFCVLRPNKGKAHNLFLYYALLTDSFTAAIGNLQRGANYPAVTDANVLDQVVQLPPLPEQRAIAAVLGKIQAAIEVQQRIVTTLKELKAATMAKLFREGTRGERLKQTEIGEMPESWEIVRLGEIAKIGNGSTPNRSNEEYWNGGSIPWITSTKIHETLITRADEFVTEKALRECHIPIVPKGSILVAITGQGKTLGNAAILDFDTCINQHLAYLSIHDSSVLPQFILFYLQGQYARLRQASTAGGSTKGALTCGFLERLSLPKPNFAEQKQIANLVMRLLRSDKLAENRQKTLTEMFSSMLHLLMTGQVRVNRLNLVEVFQ